MLPAPCVGKPANQIKLTHTHTCMLCSNVGVDKKLWATSNIGRSENQTRTHPFNHCYLPEAVGVLLSVSPEIVMMDSPGRWPSNCRVTRSMFLADTKGKLCAISLILNLTDEGTVYACA